MKRILLPFSLLAAGLLLAAAPQTSGAPKKAQPGNYLPPVINGLNKNHACQVATGICVTDQGTDCTQTTNDANGNGKIDKGELVNCKDTNNAAW